jgi:hypothetical protein
MIRSNREQLPKLPLRLMLRQRFRLEVQLIPLIQVQWCQCRRDLPEVKARHRRRL